jgi:hypothetical protein
MQLLDWMVEHGLIGPLDTFVVKWWEQHHKLPALIVQRDQSTFPTAAMVCMSPQNISAAYRQQRKVG